MGACLIGRLQSREPCTFPAESVIERFDGVGSRPDTRQRRLNLLNRAAAAAAMGAVLISALVPKPVPPSQAQSQSSSEDAQAAARAGRAEIAERVRYRGDEILIAAYSGAPYTYASDLHIERRDTDMMVHAIDWQGKPFEDPIYYGVRVARWPRNSSLGAMIDLTHSKAYAPLDQEAPISGRKDGRPLPPKAVIGDLFDK